jgi:hypothetical protein
VLSDREVWAAALLMVKRYRTNAATQAANRAEALLSENDSDGVVDWVRVIKAIEKLQTMAPAEGEGVH